MPESPSQTIPSPAVSRWRWEILLAMVVVFLARCLWIDLYGPSLPCWDEWNGELAPIAQGGVDHWPSLAELAKPHAEHRILWQRLVARGLVRLNGEWDSRLRNVTNSVFVGIYAGMLAGLLSRGFAGPRKHLLFWPVLLLTGLPFASENLLFAFQTSFHVLILLTVGAFAGVADRSPRHLRWWLGLLAGLAAIFTVGSGFFAGPVLAVWGGLRFWRGQGPVVVRLRTVWPTLLAGLVITLAGLALLQRPEDTAHMVARNAGEFVRGLLKHLAWPWREQLWIGPLLWSPLFLLAWRFLRHGADGRRDSAVRITICLGGWVLLNLLGMAFFRGAEAVGPVTRYFDFHALGLASNAAALVLLGTESTPTTGMFRWLARAGTTMWMLAAVVGAAVLLDATLRENLPETRKFYDLQARNTFRAVVMKDRSVLAATTPRFHLPYPDMDPLATWLDDPRVLALLPAAFRLRPDPAPAAANCEGCFQNPRLPDGLQTPPATRLLASSYQSEGTLRGRFLSSPICATSDWLQFWYLGKETGGSLSLRLVPVGSGKAIKITDELRASTGTWRPVTVRVAKGKEYQVEFTDDSDRAWGALTEPVPVAPWSRRVEVLCANSLWLLLGTLGAWIVLSASLAVGSSGEERQTEE